MATTKRQNITVIVPTLFQEQTVTRLMPTLLSLFSSFKKTPQAKLQVVLFVNGATAKTQQTLQKKIGKKFANLHLTGSQLNKGFTGGVNDSLIWALGHLKTNWFVVLNDDASVKAEFFERFFAEIKLGKSDVISCGVEDPAGKLESFGLDYFATGLAFPTKTIQHKRDNSNNIFCGTCVWFSEEIVKKQLQELGYLFNPLYIAYAEDLECSLRLLMDKKNITLIPESLVIHQGSLTSGKASYFQLYHGYRNLLLTIIVLCSAQHMLKNAVMIFFGQLYILLHTLYKGYWTLYPKLLWYLFKNQSELLVQRKIYEEHIGHLYTA
jgi:GT2 family glycosyltransferase